MIIRCSNCNKKNRIPQHSTIKLDSLEVSEEAIDATSDSLVLVRKALRREMI